MLLLVELLFSQFFCSVPDGTVVVYWQERNFIVI